MLPAKCAAVDAAVGTSQLWRCKRVVGAALACFFTSLQKLGANVLINLRRPKTLNNQLYFPAGAGRHV